MPSSLVRPRRHDDPVTGNPFAPDPGRLWPWVTAAVVALALIGGLVAGLLDDEPTPAAPPPVAVVGDDGQEPAPPPLVEEQAPATSEFDDADVTWVDLRGVRTPSSTAHGPFDTADGLARGFSDDELGGVMAAVHLLARTEGYAGRDIYEPTIREQTTDNGYLLQVAEDVNAERAAETGQPVGSAFEALAPTEVVGWRTRDGAGGDLVVTLTLGTTVGDDYRLLDVTAPVRQSDGQWLLVAPGSGAFDVRPAASLAGVQLFPGSRG